MILNTVRRVFVEKKQGFNVESQSIKEDFKIALEIDGIREVRLINRYDVSGVTEQVFKESVVSVFSECNQDEVYFEDISLGDHFFVVELLPGQYDQRADSAAQAIQILSGSDRPVVKYAKIIEVIGEVNDLDLRRIKNYYINPVDSKEADMEKPNKLESVYPEPLNIKTHKDFILYSRTQLEEFLENQGLAMTLNDLEFCQRYFKEDEGRDPTVTELKVIDTYWSDHCRHTTFNTEFGDIEFQEGQIAKNIKDSYEKYLITRKEVYGETEKPKCLMDLAVLAMKHLRNKGKLDDLELSSEVNACSIEVPVTINGRTENWLVMFKNETHNHPTEIEPFGGAATCLGGAIRDPLSGRSYVYQAMRVTGSGDPTVGLKETLPGKLPQRKITTEAAHGYSSYGNQIGLATGKVEEIYHEGYRAKRMEIGAVIAAAPKDNVVREEASPGDVILVVGGRTGRDGCGGATGSSKEHDEQSIFMCGSEVQKGNPPEERKIQRLFRNKTVSRMIKKCNDFGAGGVAVAIGELADSIDIDLDCVLKKYEGLDGTELAISESQERMAVVLRKQDVSDFINFAKKENLETSIVATVSDTGRLVMKWRGLEILNISREFLDTNGVRETSDIFVAEPLPFDWQKVYGKSYEESSLKKKWLKNLSDLNVASQKGLVERFDSTIGSGTVLMPMGGKYQLTPIESMVSKIPVMTGETTTCTIMSHGFDPYLSTWSPYHGSQFAIVHALAKVTATGGDYQNVRLTLQEYYEKLNFERTRWGKPFSALLGALEAQLKLDVPAIGGKDSMSGTFKDMDVPPTLVAFAVGTVSSNDVISPEFKETNSNLVWVRIKKTENRLPDYDDLSKKLNKVTALIRNKSVLAAHTIGFGGVAATLSKMSFGNKIGLKIDQKLTEEDLFYPFYGDMILEVKKDVAIGQDMGLVIGTTIRKPDIFIGDSEIAIEEMIREWSKPLEKVFPTASGKDGSFEGQQYTYGNQIKRSKSIAKPKIFIPVFPGTNCEYDTAKAFEKAGGKVEIQVFRNMTVNDLKDAMNLMVRKINEAQIISLPGGFSAGDEPEGSGKFIAAVFRNPAVSEATMNLLKKRDGLIIGICNGFQALVKLGLVQYGEIKILEEDTPTLTYNQIGRHISRFVNTKVSSNLSPWLNNCQVGDIHAIPISHGEGRFHASDEWLERLIQNGQVACQYVDENGKPTMNENDNPNGSMAAIEALTSPDGRVLGKMAHSERIGVDLHKNIPGNKNQQIFEAGIKYYL